MAAKKSTESKGLTKRRPLENFFNLPEVEKEEPEEEKQLQTKSSALKPTEMYDEKDDDIEGAYNKIHQDAMYVHQTIIDEIEDVEGSKKARMYEVAANYLNISLSAVHERAKMKEHKDKLTVKTSGGGSSKTVNNTVIMNTNDLIKQLTGQHNIIEGEVVDISNESGKKNE